MLNFANVSNTSATSQRPQHGMTVTVPKRPSAPHSNSRATRFRGGSTATLTLISFSTTMETRPILLDDHCAAAKTAFSLAPTRLSC